MKKGIGALSSLLILASLSPSPSALANPNPDVVSEGGLVTLRLGTLSVENNDGLAASIAVQPYRAKNVPWRGLYLTGKVAFNALSDFHGLDRRGVEVGYLFLGLRRGVFRLSGSAGVSIDSWDIYHDDDTLRQGTGMGAAVVVRPLLRASIFELSFPMEAGYSRAVDSSYSFIGIDLGLAFL